MAERKLNINAPLLSVRRSTATSPSFTEAKKKILEKRNTLPYYKPDLTMDQVTKPVAVPFNWEHIPGRCKGNGGSELQPPKEASITPSPRLPPGKSTNATKKQLEKEPKVTNKFRSSSKSTSFKGSVVKLDCDNERKDEKRLSNVVDFDDDDDVYSDALDTLSPTESFSMNCSVSGVSGLDNLNAKKSGTFSTDPQTRDFMMSRFLPAAKAMTLQPPQYASRKQSVSGEQPREVNRLVREEKKPLLNIPISDTVPYSGQGQEERREDEAPAAKAMTLQPPQYASRKQSVSGEQPREFNRLIREEKKPLLNIPISDTVPYSGQGQEERREDEAPATKAMTLQPPQYASRKQSVSGEQPREFNRLVREEKKPLLNIPISDTVPYSGQGQEEKSEDEAPAAKAMTLQPPKYASRKQSVSGEQPREVNRLIRQEKKPLLNIPISNTVPYSGQGQEEESEDEVPAAKAMALLPPQYASRKQSVAVEQPREVNRLVREEKKPLLNIQISEIVPYSGHGQEEESEDEGDDYDDSANISAKGCGLFPRLRIGNSLCLLNPVPGMKMRNQAPLSITSEVRKPGKGSHIRAYSPAPAVKKAWDAISKTKSSSRAASPDRHDIRKKWTSESNRFTYSGELQQPGRLSPFCRSRAAAAGISPCRSKPQSPFCGARLLGDSKEAENNQAGKLKFQNRCNGNIQEVLSLAAKKIQNSGSPTVEKTLYIDTASNVKLSYANSSSVDNTRRIESVVEDLDKIKGKGNISSIESSRDIKKLQTLEEKDMLGSAVLGSVDANSSTLSKMLHIRSQEDKAAGLVTNVLNQEYASSQLEGTADKDSNIKSLQIVVAENSGNGVDSGLSPLPPPLPKSPSESWLWRALPLVSVKNSFLHSNQGTHSHAKRQDSSIASSNSKWETIVKTSNLHHDHVRYSQELTIHKSRHSKY